MAELVVGAAVVCDGRVLAARRAHPPALAGRWELPGGKVEPGESPSVALLRELAEELGAHVVVDHWLDLRVPVRDGLDLAVAVVRLAPGARPAPTEHDALRWLTAEQLQDVDWLDPDRPFLPLLADLMNPAEQHQPHSSQAEADRPGS